MVDNTFIKDTRLSWKAKGLIVSAMSLPKEILSGALVMMSKDGRDSTYNGLKELITYGYCIREERRREDGTISGYAYRVSDKPLTENPFTDNPHTEKETEKESKKESCIEKETKKEDKERNELTIFPSEPLPMLERVKAVNVAEFVKMSQKEYNKLCDRFGKGATDEMITILDNAKGAKGYKYKSDYRAILTWVVGEYEKRHKDDRKEEGRNATSLFR